MSQTDKNNQIFSLKSNLISNCKAVSYGLANRKNTQHLRMKSLCFSSMLNSIRNQAGKDKYRQKQRETLQYQKQNYGIAVSVHKCKPISAANVIQTLQQTKGHEQETPIIVEPPRVSIPQSRSFLIRPHSKKPTSINLQARKHQIKQSEKLHQIHLSITLKKYNFQSAKQILHQVQLLPIKNQTNINNIHNNLSLIIPGNLLKSQSTSHMLSLLKILAQKKYKTFIIAQTKQRAKQLYKIYKQFCYILYLEGQQKITYNRQYFINFTKIKQHISKNIVIFQQATYQKDSILYYPYVQEQLDLDFKNSYGIRQLFGQVQEQQDWKMAFVKLDSLNKVKYLQLENQFVKIDLHNFVRKPKLTNPVYKLTNTVKMQIQSKFRYSRLNNANLNSTANFPSVQSMQQKLLQYSKILKIQKKIPIYNSNPQITPNQNCLDLKLKQQANNRRQISKTNYQIINQLIRNNLHIQKQIHSYFNQCRNVNLYEQKVQCDDIYYYHIQ